MKFLPLILSSCILAQNPNHSTQPVYDTEFTDTQAAQTTNDDIIEPKYVMENTDKGLFNLEFDKDATSLEVFKNGRRIAAIDRAANSEGVQYQLNFSPNDQTWTSKLKIQGNYLYIKNAQLENEGIYKIIYEAWGLEEEQKVLRNNLLVVRNPTLTIITNENLQLDGTNETRQKVFKVATCQAKKSKPEAELEWVYKGNVVPEKFSQRALDSRADGVDYASFKTVKFRITPEMNGDKLECRVKKGFPGLTLDEEFRNTGSKVELALEIDYPPRNTQITVVKNNTLECQTDSNPPADFSWFMNDALLDAEASIFDFTNRTNLLVNNETIVCRANNGIGRISSVSENPNLLFSDYFTQMEMQQASGVDFMIILYVILGILLVAILVLGCWKAYEKFLGNKNNSNNNYTQGDLEKQNLTTESKIQPIISGQMPNDPTMQNMGLVQHEMSQNMDTMTRNINNFNENADQSMVKETYSGFKDEGV